MNIKQDINMARKPMELEQKYRLGDINTSAQNIKTLSKTKVDKEAGKGLSSNDFTNTYKNILDRFLNLTYPVGSIYMSVSSESPSTLFGGTWVQIQDTFLLACGTTYSNGDVGGEVEHTLTVEEMPSHTHEVWSRDIYNSTGTAGASIHWNASGSVEKATGSTGSGQAHNNMPPYLAVYMWKRTA